VKPIWEAENNPKANHIDCSQQVGVWGILKRDGEWRVTIAFTLQSIKVRRLVYISMSNGGNIKPLRSFPFGINFFRVVKFQKRWKCFGR